MGRLPTRGGQCAVCARHHVHLRAVATVSDVAWASGVARAVYIRSGQGGGVFGYADRQTMFRAQYASFGADYGQRLAQ
ncbi:MurR/RpiR family transcriptional regulator, partial [Tritonibacter sp. SIMBA_163]